MGASSLAGQERPHAGRRSIRFTFTAMVIVPAVCLVLLWGVAVSAALGGGRGLSRHPRGSHADGVVRAQALARCP